MSKKLIQAAAGAGGESIYVEDVFSTYLYEGNGFYPSGGGQTITNGIDLDGEGGMIWIKVRNPDGNHGIYDTERGISQMLGSNLTAQEYTDNAMVSANSDGFTLGAESSGWGRINMNGYDYVSWTFRKAEKFFDVVTWTGTGSGPRVINHNLGANIGFLLIKCTSNADNWYAHHASVNFPLGYGFLDTTDSWNTTGSYVSAADDTSFTLSGVGNNVSGRTYVAYLFASDAGGFGDDGSESIIKCGSLVSGTVQDINLGWEPQFIIYKNASSTGGWTMFDVMRGMTTDGSGTYIQANTSAAEATASAQPSPLANGFRWNYTGNSGNTFIYIAIRRPMKTPESGTEVFALQTQTPSGSDYVMADSSGFPIDWLITRRPSITSDWFTTNRLTNNYLIPNTTAPQATYSYGFDLMEGVSAVWNANLTNSFAFKRATGFFDVVAYTGDGTNKVIPHNLGVKPELIITKPRSNPTSSTTDWVVYAEPLTNSNFLYLNTDSAAVGAALYPSEPTADNYTVLGSSRIGDSGGTNISYLFATLAGVSKVGSYTGTAADLNVDCGFSAGARFILIKRTDSTGDWYVYDSERGIVAGNDPYLLLNSTAAEVTGTDYIDPLSSGFTVTSSAPAGLNASGGTYIFLAIA